LALSASVYIYRHLSASSLIHVGVRAPQTAGLPLAGNPACLLFTIQIFKVFVSTFLNYWIFITPMKFWEFKKENKVTHFLPAYDALRPLNSQF